MFRLRRPTTGDIDRQVAAAKHFQVDGPQFLTLPYGIKTDRIAPGFAHDDSRSHLGHGEAVFAAAKRSFAAWAQFDLGWVRVTDAKTPIAVGEVVAVEVRSLGLWTLNLSRIVQVYDAADMFGFIYSTTQMHVEQGDERFLLEFDGTTGDVWYELEAVSRPRGVLARFAYPVTRHFQHRFARDSHKRMKHAFQNS